MNLRRRRRRRLCNSTSSCRVEEMLLAEEALPCASDPTHIYTALRWIPGTSNEFERLISRAGLVFLEHW